MSDYSLILPVLIYLLFSLFLYFSRNNIAHKIASLFVITCASEFIKRFIYIFGDTGNELYYLVLFIPDFIIILDLMLKKKLDRKVIIFFLLISFYFIVSILNGQSISSILIMIRTIGLPIFLFISIGYKVTTTDREVRQAFALILSVVLLSTFYSIYQFTIDYTVWEYNWNQYSPASMNLDAMTYHGMTKRAFGFFSEIANQGAAFALAFLYTYYCYENNFNKFILLSVIFIGLVVTASKSAIVGLFLIILGFKFFLRFKSRLVWLVIGFGLLIYNSRSFVYFFIDLFAQVVPTDILKYIDPATFLYRVYIIENFFTYMDMSPINILIGKGFGYETGISLDNLFLYLIYRTGIIGFIIFLYIINKLLKSLKIDESISKFAFASLIFIFLFSFTSLVFTTRSGLFLFLLIILILIYKNSFNRKSIKRATYN